MPHYLTTDELIENILKTIATGSKIQVVGTSDSLRDVSPAVTCLLRPGVGRDAGCMFWDGRPSAVTVQVDVQEGDPRLTISMGKTEFLKRNAVYEQVLWEIATRDQPERDAIRSKRVNVTVPPALAAMDDIDRLARLIFAAVKKAATGY